MLLILALWKLRQEVPEFEVSRGSVVRLGLKKKEGKEKEIQTGSAKGAEVRS